MTAPTIFIVYALFKPKMVLIATYKKSNYENIFAIYLLYNAPQACDTNSLIFYRKNYLLNNKQKIKKMSSKRAIRAVTIKRS